MKEESSIEKGHNSISHGFHLRSLILSIIIIK